MFERTGYEPGLQGIHIQGRGRTKSQIGSHQPAMTALGPPIGVQRKHPWGKAELFSDKRHRDFWRGRKVRWHKPQIPEGTQLEGIPQTAEGFALAVHFTLIGIREQKIPCEIILRNRLRKALPAVPLGSGEKAGRHGALLSANVPFLRHPQWGARSQASRPGVVAVCRLINQGLTNSPGEAHYETIR